MRGNRIAVLLRGVNVGGKHPMPMPELRALFSELGCDDIDTYLQSGNLVCTAHPSLTAAAMAEALAEHFDFPVPVVLRTAAELTSCVRDNPFSMAGADSLHVVFFAEPPNAATMQLLERKCIGKEQLAAHGRELFLYLPHGFGRSKLGMACTAPSLAGSSTVRNWKTVLQVQQMF